MHDSFSGFGLLLDLGDDSASGLDIDRVKGIPPAAFEIHLVRQWQQDRRIGYNPRRARLLDLTGHLTAVHGHKGDRPRIGHLYKVMTKDWRPLAGWACDGPFHEFISPGLYIHMASQ